MKAEIITIGDEILIGQITDTNSAWIGQQLNRAGLLVSRITSISDTEDAIIGAMASIKPETKLVLITGGLGPTKDDITKKTLASFFNMKMEYREEIYTHIEDLFKSMGRTPSERNREQALVPVGSDVLFNHVGTAPGMLFKQHGCFYVSMPGVPYEMKHLMHNHVLPLVEKEILRQHIVHETIVVAGIPESDLADQLHEFEENLPEFIKMAYLPRPGLVRLRLTAKGSPEDNLDQAVLHQITRLKDILGDAVLGKEQDTLEKIIGKKLTARKETLATAESCTGGYIAHMITSVAGSSAYYLGSVVAYSNAVKEKQLGVKKEILTKNGAVSEAVVLQMAEGVRKTINTDWGIATSGIAGPDGGTEDKPVGTVWIGISGPTGSLAKRFQFGKNRERNIKKSALMALDLLRNALG